MKVKVAASALLSCVLALSLLAGPALADGRHHGRRGHGHAHGWDRWDRSTVYAPPRIVYGVPQPRVIYGPPRVVYLPPPVLYTPGPSLSFVFPLR